MNLNRTDDWHLHLTVTARNPVVASGYVGDCDFIGWRPTVIENLPGGLSGGIVQPEQELIPTLKMGGAELGQALILLHDVSKVLALKGWVVRRAKIEGRTRDEGDAMYSEAHVEMPSGADRATRLISGLPLSRSLTSGKLYATARSLTASDAHVQEMRNQLAEQGLIGAKTEWIAYDSNRALDAPWFRSWGCWT